MISIHAFAEDALVRACVPALSIDPSGSRKAHYFRDDTVVEATDMVSRDSSCRRDSIAIWADGGSGEFSFARTVELTYGKRMSIGRPSFRAMAIWNSRGMKASLGS